MMARRGLAAAVIVGWCGVAAPVAAQSLGDVARQEEARRVTAKKATKSFSNADLKPSEIAPVSGAMATGPAAVAAAAGEPCDKSKSDCAPAAEAAPSTSEKISAEELAKQEPNWRSRAGGLRDQLAKAQQEVDALAVTADDPSRSPGERGVAQRMVALRQSVLDGLERRWASLEREAEERGVPRHWLDPRPVMTPRMPQ